MARIPFAEPEPGTKAANVLDRLPLNVARIMAHAPAVMLAFQGLGGAILRDTAFAPNLRELAILRIGHRLGATYEVCHHERIGRAVGLSEDQLVAARTGAGGADDDRLVLAVADAVEDGGRIDEALFLRAQARFGDQGLVELVMAAAFYGMVSRFLVAFEVEVEADEQTLPGIG
jgi:alkylhydroperoxidase family enzyme